MRYVVAIMWIPINPNLLCWHRNTQKGVSALSTGTDLVSKQEAGQDTGTVSVCRELIAIIILQCAE